MDKKEKYFNDPYLYLDKIYDIIFTIDTIKCNYSQYHNDISSIHFKLKINISSWQSSQLEKDANLRGSIEY